MLAREAADFAWRFLPAKRDREIGGRKPAIGPCERVAEQAEEPAEFVIHSERQRADDRDEGAIREISSACGHLRSEVRGTFCEAVQKFKLHLVQRRGFLQNISFSG